MEGGVVAGLDLGDVVAVLLVLSGDCGVGFFVLVGCRVASPVNVVDVHGGGCWNWWSVVGVVVDGWWDTCCSVGFG